MLPVLKPRDTILVRLGSEAKPGDLVVAQLGDDGYVVKQLSERNNQSVTLTSFNADFGPLSLLRSEVHLFGVVIACFRSR